MRISRTHAALTMLGASRPGRLNNEYGSVCDADQILFTAIITGKKHAMKLHIGLGDTAAAVLTLMLPYED